MRLPALISAVVCTHAMAMPTLYGELKVGRDHEMADYGSYVGLRGELAPFGEHVAFLYQAETSLDLVDRRSTTGDSHVGLRVQDHTIRVGTSSNVMLDHRYFGKVNPWFSWSADNGLGSYGRFDGSMKDSIRVDANFEHGFMACQMSKDTKSCAAGAAIGDMTLGAAKLGDATRGEVTVRHGDAFLATGAQIAKSDGATIKDLAITTGVTYGRWTPMVSYAKGTGYTHRIAGVEYQWDDQLTLQAAYGSSTRKVTAISAVLRF